MLNAYHLYRIARQLYLWKIPLLPKLIKLLIFLLYNSSIPYQAKIGKGSRFGYGGIGLVLHKRTIIGKNCMIGTNVTVGGKSGCQKISETGNNVYMATGAKIIGSITIENITIGANAVVLKDIHDNAIVVGVPAKIIRILDDGEVKQYVR